MEVDIPPDPADIRLLRRRTEMPGPDPLADRLDKLHPPNLTESAPELGTINPQTGTYAMRQPLPHGRFCRLLNRQTYVAINFVSQYMPAVYNTKNSPASRGTPPALTTPIYTLHSAVPAGPRSPQQSPAVPSSPQQSLPSRPTRIMTPINGMTSASHALRYWEHRQEITANNLANVSTNGFKGERSFAQLIGGEPVIGTHIDRSTGNIRMTGERTDLALGDDSFLIVGTDRGERWSRGGSLRVDPQGFLADQDGNRVLGKKGAIKVGDDHFQVSKHGIVTVGDQVIDELRVESAPNGLTLEHEGNSLLLPAGNRTSVALDKRDIRQGQLEESNVDSLGQMVDMLGVQRAFAAVEKSISVLDHVRETATSQLGKPVA